MAATKEIDETDIVIIRDLLLDARKSFAAIANEIGVSTANISKHFSDLQKKGIIVGSTIQLDYKKIGYNAVCDFAIKCDRKFEEMLIEYGKTMPNIYSFNKTNNAANIKVVAILRDLKELDQTKEILKKSSYINDLRVQIWTGIKNYPENLFISDIKNLTNPFISSAIRIDNIDEKLIKSLSRNSQAAFIEISKEIETSVDTVARRYKQLVGNKVIKPCIQLDMSKIGYKAVAKFFISCESDIESVIKALMLINDSYLIIKTDGKFDLTFSVALKGIEQFFYTRRNIEAIVGINKIESTIDPIPIVFPSPCQYISTF